MPPEPAFNGPQKPRSRYLRAGSTGLLALLGLIGMVTVGCSQAPTVVNNPTELSADQYRPVLDASVEVLRQSGFSVDRMDFRFGRVTSKPKGSPTVFEPWVADNTYIDQAFTSTLGDLRRTVTVAIDRTAAPASADQAEAGPAGEEGLSVRVEVLLERFQVPIRRMNGRTQGSVFTDLSAVPQELSRRGIAAAYWRPVGRDVHLEQRLLESILQQSGLLPG